MIHALLMAILSVFPDKSGAIGVSGLAFTIWFIVLTQVLPEAIVWHQEESKK